ncbi:hypothetical protein J2Z69_002914 [Paenibacillus shirakamiensis]|uniref:Uncharacterized protein n=1 Tax=Paenibacillus shirakamiensis TaxID=1265935 RepID=A0ABS4JJJ2_9BACL|nr:hypothetical protein [Paenibacillus shirakamiensis]MBP2001858.1 hypothetical protein [Paenibacillus shirakamiensis]
MAERARLSMPESRVLEEALRTGIPATALMEMSRKGDFSGLPRDEDGDKDSGWEGLIAFAVQQPKLFRQALQEGYTIKFVTVGGLRTLLLMKWGLQPNQDYDMVENQFLGVKLRTEEATELQQLVAVPWKVTLVTAGPDGQNVYRISH